MMLNWKNLDTLASYEELKKVEPVNVAEAMSGENGAERVKNYSIPMMIQRITMTLPERSSLQLLLLSQWVYLWWSFLL